MKMEVSSRVTSTTHIATAVVHVRPNTTSAPPFNNLYSFKPSKFPVHRRSVRLGADRGVPNRETKIILHRRHVPVLRQLIGHLPVGETPVQHVLRSAYANKHAGRIEVGTH
jgi:hypothetical protein